MNTKNLFLLLCFTLAGYVVSAQPTAGDPNGGEAPVPISGIEILLVLGGALGLKKIIGLRKEKK